MFKVNTERSLVWWWDSSVSKSYRYTWVPDYFAPRSSTAPSWIDWRSLPWTSLVNVQASVLGTANAHFITGACTISYTQKRSGITLNSQLSLNLNCGSRGVLSSRGRYPAVSSGKQRGWGTYKNVQFSVLLLSSRT